MGRKEGEKKRNKKQHKTDEEMHTYARIIEPEQSDLFNGVTGKFHFDDVI